MQNKDEYNEGYANGFHDARKLLFKDAPIRVCGNISYDMNKYFVTYKGKEVSLTRTYYSLLDLLMSGRTYTKTDLYSWLWPLEDEPECTNLLDVTFCNMRKRFIVVGAPPDIIITQRGLGWRLNSEK